MSIVVLLAFFCGVVVGCLIGLALEMLRERPRQRPITIRMAATNDPAVAAAIEKLIEHASLRGIR